MRITWKEKEKRSNQTVPLGVNQKRRVGNSQTGHRMWQPNAWKLWALTPSSTGKRSMSWVNSVLRQFLTNGPSSLFLFSLKSCSRNFIWKFSWIYLSLERIIPFFFFLLKLIISVLKTQAFWIKIQGLKGKVKAEKWFWNRMPLFSFSYRWSDSSLCVSS